MSERGGNCCYSDVWSLRSDAHVYEKASGGASSAWKLDTRCRVSIAANLSAELCRAHEPACLRNVLFYV